MHQKMDKLPLSMQVMFDLKAYKFLDNPHSFGQQHVMPGQCYLARDENGELKYDTSLENHGTLSVCVPVGNLLFLLDKGSFKMIPKYKVTSSTC